MSISFRFLVALFLTGLTCQAAAGTGMLDRIKTSQSVTVAYAPNAAPISFEGENGQPGGYSVELCRRILEGIQRELKLDTLEIKWTEGNTPRRLAAVANGEADLECGTTSMNLQRQREVDFSTVVFVESGGILVLADSGIESLADLSEKKLAVIPQTTTEKRLRAVLAERLIGAEFVPVKDTKEGTERLAKGGVDAVAGDRLVLIGQVAATGEPERFAILDAEFSIDPYAFAMPRNHADFRLAVNRGLAQIYRSGEIERIFRRWFGEDARPTELLAAIFYIFGFSD
jgi:ABC-type amino acid transport substrate-binding protein